LTGDLAGLQGDRVLAPLKGLGDFVEQAHALSSLGGGQRNAIPGASADVAALE
jgi:hypothetical protein